MKMKNYSRYESFKKNGPTKQKMIKDRRRRKYEMRIPDNFSSSSCFQDLNRQNYGLDLDDLVIYDDLDLCLPPPPPPPPPPPDQLQQHSDPTTTEVILPPPPPLYEYPPYSHRPDFSPSRFYQNLYTIPTKNNRVQYPVGSTIDKQMDKITADQQRFYTHREHTSTGFKRSPSPLPSKNYNHFIKHAVPKQIGSSDSENSDFNTISENKRYEKEKKGAEYFNYNKASNYLLKYPGFGDCVSSGQTTTKLKSKIAPSNSTIKVRKKIKDKYRRDGTSVRCLIRNAFTTKTRNDYEKKDFILDKSKQPAISRLLTTDSKTKITTLFQKTFDDFSIKPQKDRTQMLFNNARMMSKPVKNNLMELSKNPFCVLSDSIPTSDSNIKTNSVENINKIGQKIVKSESIPWPQSNNVKTKIMQRHSEEFLRQRTISISKRHASSMRENRTLEFFRKSKHGPQDSFPPPSKLCDNVTTSDESIVHYFNLLDKIAEKRRQFKREERRKMRIQELAERQMKLL